MIILNKNLEIKTLYIYICTINNETTKSNEID
jgi:hypothetical protein